MSLCNNKGHSDKLPELMQRANTELAVTWTCVITKAWNADVFGTNSYSKGKAGSSTFSNEGNASSA